MTMATAPASILVVGNGLVAHAAAIAFRRALPSCAVTMLLPDAPLSVTDRVGAGGAAMLRFHDLIGLDHAQFLARTRGQVVTEQLWQCNGLAAVQRVLAADIITYHAGIALHQLWLAYPDAGEWSAIAMASDTGFGVRFDAQRYLALLADFARHLGVVSARIDGWQAEVSGSGEAIVALTDSGGERWSADFYIDASSAPSPMMLALGAAWRDWSGQIPPVTLTETDDPHRRDPVDTINLGNPAIQWDSPVWSARFAAAPVGSGRIETARKGNAMALGDAACVAESFDGGSLAIAMLDIIRALALLPGSNPSPREAAEHARQSAIVHDLHGDWAAARWLGVDGASERELRPGLSAILTQFGERGRIPVRDMDPVPAGHWLGWLIALGMRPRRVDPTAWAIDSDTARKILNQAASRSSLSRI